VIMADVFTFVFLILGFWLALPALCLSLRAAFPNAVTKSQRHIAQRPGRSLVAGIVVGIPSFVVSVAATAALPGGGKLIGLLLVAGLFLYSFVGIAGLVTHLGQRLGSPADDAQPWLQTLRGAVCLVMPATIPVLGWFLIVPLVFLLGVGTTTISFFNSGDVETPESAPESASMPIPVGETREMVEMAGATS
jgi:hypothetical protein